MLRHSCDCQGSQTKCLVFLSHGFSEHLGLYHEIANILGVTILDLDYDLADTVLVSGDKKMLVFGHDHIGHGESDGDRAYIENVDHYVDDVIHHCMIVQVRSSLHIVLSITTHHDRISILTSLCISWVTAWEE